MSHQIETHGTRAAALFARTDPWHRLGTTVRGEAFTAEDAMTLGHLGKSGHAQGPAVRVGGHHRRRDPHGRSWLRHGAHQPVHPAGRSPRGRRRRDTPPCRTRSTQSSSTGWPMSRARSSTPLAACAAAVRSSSPCACPSRSSSVAVDHVDLNIAALNSHDGNSAFRLLITPGPGRLRQHPVRRAARATCRASASATPATRRQQFRPRATRSG